MLRISGLSVHLGRRAVIGGLDLAALPGAVTVILGPNGSGKSTLIRAATGELPYTGSITLAGEEIRAAPAWRLAARRGVLEQATQVAFPFTVAEIVRLGLQSGLAAGREGLVMQALAEVGMADTAARPFHELSGGQQARVHLARVRAQVWEAVDAEGPRWLFLDEPVAALDIAHQLAVMRIMRDFADAGGGVVAVMHDLNLSAMIADRMVLLSEGRIIAEGPPDAVISDGPLSRAYGCALRVGQVPVSGPWLLPQAARI
ncbi:heme ABC transporter ATP-binding protein [Paenirhodobacter sp.]|uniref:heme ABC transporter ATP-binding protein n=1 Tax=Paenirhodobacter sp. TaxID=1965326 RepID=UPI003B405904